MNQSFNYHQTTYSEPLHQPIDVNAEFRSPHLHRGKYGPPCRPVSFRTKAGREVVITEIGLIHPKYDGLRTNWAFDVTDGAGDFRLVFNSENLQWFLEFEGDYNG